MRTLHPVARCRRSGCQLNRKPNSTITIASTNTTNSPHQHLIFALLSLLVLLLFIAIPVAAQAANDRPQAANNPYPKDHVASAAYGILRDAHGNAIEPTEALIRQTLEYYADELLSDADCRVAERYAQLGGTLEQMEDVSGMDAAFLMLEWLTEAVAPENKAQIYAINRTLRMAWYKATMGEKQYYQLFDNVSGLPDTLASIGDKQDMLRKATTATGEQYLAE